MPHPNIHSNDFHDDVKGVGLTVGEQRAVATSWPRATRQASRESDGQIIGQT